MCIGIPPGLPSSSSCLAQGTAVPGFCIPGTCAERGALHGICQDQTHHVPPTSLEREPRAVVMEGFKIKLKAIRSLQDPSLFG